MSDVKYTVNSDATPSQVMKKHNCGACQNGFDTEEEYLNHVCPISGFVPTDPNNLGEDFKKIQEAALKRGAEAKK